jgi:hypothetical protein
MAAKRKASTKMDLETKIAELEEKLTKLSSQLEAKSAPKPAKIKPSPAKPAEKPVATTKPKGTLPKGFEEKPAEVPKPADTTSQPPATVQAALEDAYMTAPMTPTFSDYKAKVTGYTPAPNRYFVRKTAPVGKVPTKNWNDQKATVTGYTAVSNQYYATRARMAYHPADKRFGSFSGVNMSVEGVAAQTQQTPTPEPPKPAKEKLPKGMEQAQQAPPQQQSTNVADDGKSRVEKLANYEADYLQRIEQQKIDDEKAFDELLEAEDKARSTASRGTLPKGFEPKQESEPEAPKTSRGTLPKGF